MTLCEMAAAARGRRPELQDVLGREEFERLMRRYPDRIQRR
jgi:hypothetical protein